MKMHTTLNEIRKHYPCEESWKKLLSSLDKTKSDDTKVSYEYILDTLDIEDAIWSLRCHSDTKLVRKFACDCTDGSLKFYDAKYPDDMRPRDCIKAARDYMDGKITLEELRKARAYAADAAYAAADAADAAAYAADAAAYAARKKQRGEQAILFREYFCKEAK